MPLYEYQCEKCEHRFEVIQKYSDPLVTTCPTCGGPVRKLLSSPAFQFKGTGWYITDYARKGQTEGGKAGGATDGSAKDGSAKDGGAKDGGGSDATSDAAKSGDAGGGGKSEPTSGSTTSDKSKS